MQSTTAALFCAPQNLRSRPAPPKRLPVPEAPLPAPQPGRKPAVAANAARSSAQLANAQAHDRHPEDRSRGLQQLPPPSVAARMLQHAALQQERQHGLDVAAAAADVVTTASRRQRVSYLTMTRSNAPRTLQQPDADDAAHGWPEHATYQASAAPAPRSDGRALPPAGTAYGHMQQPQWAALPSKYHPPGAQFGQATGGGWALPMGSVGQEALYAAMAGGRYPSGPLGGDFAMDYDAEDDYNDEDDLAYLEEMEFAAYAAQQAFAMQQQQQPRRQRGIDVWSAEGEQLPASSRRASVSGREAADSPPREPPRSDYSPPGSRGGSPSRRVRWAAPEAQAQAYEAGRRPPSRRSSFGSESEAPTRGILKKDSNRSSGSQDFGRPGSASGRPGANRSLPTSPDRSAGSRGSAGQRGGVASAGGRPYASLPASPTSNGSAQFFEHAALLNRLRALKGSATSSSATSSLPPAAAVASEEAPRARAMLPPAPAAAPPPLSPAPLPADPPAWLRQRAERMQAAGAASFLDEDAKRRLGLHYSGSSSGNGSGNATPSFGAGVVGSAPEAATAPSGAGASGSGAPNAASDGGPSATEQAQRASLSTPPSTAPADDLPTCSPAATLAALRQSMAFLQAQQLRSGEVELLPGERLFFDTLYSLFVSHDDPAV